MNQFQGMFTAMVVSGFLVSACGENEKATISINPNGAGSVSVEVSRPQPVAAPVESEPASWHFCDWFVADPQSGDKAAIVDSFSGSVKGYIPKGKVFVKDFDNRRFSDVYRVKYNDVSGDVSEADILDTCPGTPEESLGLIPLANVTFSGAGSDCTLIAGQGYVLNQIQEQSSDSMAKVKFASTPQGCSFSEGRVAKAAIRSGQIYFGATSPGLKRLKEILAAETSTPVTPPTTPEPAPAPAPVTPAPVTPAPTAPSSPVATSRCSMDSSSTRLDNKSVFSSYDFDERLGAVTTLKSLGVCEVGVADRCSMDSSSARLDGKGILSSYDFDDRVEAVRELVAVGLCKTGLKDRCSMDSSAARLDGKGVLSSYDFTDRLKAIKELDSMGLCEKDLATRCSMDSSAARLDGKAVLSSYDFDKRASALKQLKTLGFCTPGELSRCSMDGNGVRVDGASVLSSYDFDTKVAKLQALKDAGLCN